VERRRRSSGDGGAARATPGASDAVEVAWPRHLLRDLLSGIGEPYIVVRLGYLDSPEPLPPAPRRDPSEVIKIDQ
jgi:hypothetical protein